MKSYLGDIFPGNWIKNVIVFIYYFKFHREEKQT